MKKYIKPITEIIVINEACAVLMSNSEPESTENIGAKENNIMFDLDDDEWNDDLFSSLWED